MNAQQEDDHIIMFPFMAQGHIIPFLSLAKLICQRKPNTKITLVSTPVNIKYLELTLTSENMCKNICLAQLPFSATEHGLPPHSENTDSLPSHLIATLFYASETLQPCFDSLITQIITTEKRVPSCIISDVFFGWVNHIAKRVGTYHFSFTTGGGYGTAVYFSLYLYLPHRKNDTSSNDLVEEFHVLSHKSTGAFLSHCGWNSVLESLSQGVPIIGWPLAAEQCYNSKMMEEEMGVCMELARVDGQVVSEDVKDVIEQVMDSSKGEEMRNKAMVIGEKIRAAMTEDKEGEGDAPHQKGSSVRSVDDFLSTITSKKVEA